MGNKIHEQTKIEAAIRQAAEEGWTELDFNYRQFLELPKSLLAVKGLRKLRLFECGIKIPAWLSELQSLEELDIGEINNVEELLPVIHKLHNLRILKMGYTDIKALPDTFSLLQNLEELILNAADFTIFPQCIGELKKLRTLSFKYCYCDPDDVFNVLAQLPNLRELRITFDIHEYEKGYSVDIPPSLLKLSSLEVLDLHDFSELQSLPENIHELNKLKKLDISQDSDYGCQLAQLPASLFDIASFEHLNITDCQQIIELPQSIEHWRTPKVFRCAGTGLKTFPAFSKEQMAKLEKLTWQGQLPDLSHSLHMKRLAFYNDLGMVSFNQQVSGTECAFKYDLPVLPELEELYILGGILADTDFLLNFPRLKRLCLFCDFQELTEHIGRLQNLEEIYISGARKMQGLPAGFSLLRSLKLLNISASSLSEVPQDMHYLEKLEVVTFDNITGMTELSAGWYSLPALKILKIEDCREMKTIPNGISRLASLERLVLHRNEKLFKMPRDFGSLKNLRSLDWRGNWNCKLPDFSGLDALEMFELRGYSPDAIPDSFFSLPKLEYFSHSCSEAEHLPERYATFPALKILELSSWNCLRSVPERLVQNSSLKALVFHQCDFTEIPKGLENPCGVERISFCLCDKIKDALRSVSGPLAEKLNKYP